MVAKCCMFDVARLMVAKCLDGCCSQVVVASTGNARIDQALYMGIYTRVDNKYNGRPVYRRQGRNSLFIYFFTR